VSSGAQRLEAAALVTDAEPSDEDRAVADELGVAAVIVADPSGTVRS